MTDFFLRMFRRPLYPAAFFSLLLHIIIVLMSGDGDPQKSLTRKEIKKKRLLARVKLQTIPLAPAASAPATVQVFREDLFKDTKDEEKNLFKLRKTEDGRRKVKVDYDRDLRSLIMPGKKKRGDSGSNKAVVPFYSLDRLPQPKRPLTSKMRFPDRAVAMGIREFSIVVEMVIDTKGRLVESRLVSAASFGFGKAVLAGLKDMEFKPGRLGGKAVRSLLRERILFTNGGR